MDLFAEVKAHVLAAIDGLVADGRLPEGLDLGAVTVEPPRDPAHGDMATNAATENAMMNDLTHNDADTNLANGM